MKLKELQKYFGNPDPFNIRLMIAREVIRARVHSKMTRKELAEKSGLLVESIARLESGEHAPNLTTLGKISRALNKPLTIKFK